jgi:hypothetical protein
VDIASLLAPDSLSRSVLPAISASVACAEYSGLGELGYVAGAAAGACIESSAVAAFLAGRLAAHFLPKMLVYTAQRGMPATSATIFAVGGTTLHAPDHV